MQNQHIQSLLGQIGGAAGTALGGPLGGVAASAAINGLGALLLGGGPKPPDLVSEREGEYRDAFRRLGQTLGRQQDRADDTAAARGYTGSGGVAQREALMRAGADAYAGLEASRADALAEAGNQQRMMRYGLDREKYLGRAGAIGGLGQDAAFALAMRGLGGPDGGRTAPVTATPGSSADMAAGAVEAGVVGAPGLTPMPRASMGGLPPHVLAALRGVNWSTL